VLNLAVDLRYRRYAFRGLAVSLLAASHLRGLTLLVHPAGVERLSLQSMSSKINSIPLHSQKFKKTTFSFSDDLLGFVEITYLLQPRRPHSVHIFCTRYDCYCTNKKHPKNLGAWVLTKQSFCFLKELILSN
jgi:hypothetical protein